MDKAIIEKIYLAIVSALVTFVVGFALKKLWTMVTGSEPPDPEDLDVPARQAIPWFLASGIGVGVAQLAVSRTVRGRVRTMGTRKTSVSA